MRRTADLPRPGARLGALAAALATALALAAAPAPARADDDPLADSYALEAKHDLAGAARAMRKAADAAPRSYFAHLRLGYLAAQVGDRSGAVAAYRAAVELEPTAVEPLLGLQAALIASAQWDDARGIGLRVIAADPLSYLGGSRLAWTLYQLKDYRASAEQYAAVLARYPGDVDMRLGLGWALLGEGKKAEAAEAFRAVLAMVPKHAGATQGLAATAK